ncbi:UNVERIFIED_CONTAM: Retrovirus-related Pol polyprotein from transposon RE1 [Sesamum indicum]
MKCIFLGYASNQKGYKVYDLKRKSMMISRDVTFYEDVFPYNNESSDPISCSLPIIFSDTDFDDTEGLDQPTAADTGINNNVDENQTVGLRRSTRQTNQPVRLQDYTCSYTKTNTDIPLIQPSHHIHKCFLIAANNPSEPKNFSEAMKGKEWVKAMDNEIRALEDNETWEITKLPKDKKVIGSKWIYKLKLKQDGSIDRYKARLVAKGYNQIEGVDYLDSFSPVAKAITIRILLTLGAKHKWHLHQLDINNAFLHGFLDEDIYMVPPEGYTIPKDHVCKLKRSLYGLKQASRQWNQEFTCQLEKYGFRQSKLDHCLFTKQTEKGLFCLLVYVDDVLLAGPCQDTIIDIKDYLHNLFTIKDLGEARFFLGLEICRSSEGIMISQTKYIHDIISDVGLTYGKATNTPLPAGIKLSSTDSEQLQNPEPYRRLLGRLLYLGFSRPDICYGTQQLSQHMQHPSKFHWEAAIHMVKYLKGTSNRGLLLNSEDKFELQAFCDADWASCKDTRKSLTGYYVFLGNALISWKTKKQTTVSRSSAEAEYRSMATTTCELIWIYNLLQELQVNLPTRIKFHCDNQSALYITTNPVFHERTKHIEMDCHIVRDKYKQGFILPLHISSRFQTADIFTKALLGPRFLFLISKKKAQDQLYNDRDEEIVLYRNNTFISERTGGDGARERRRGIWRSGAAPGGK